MNRLSHCVILPALSLLVGSAVAAEVASLSSPNGKVVCRVSTTDGAGGAAALRYEVVYNGETVVQPSGVSYAQEDWRVIGANLADLAAGDTEEHHGAWEPVYGERATIRDDYNAVKITGRDTATGHQLTFSFRCYDAGAAFQATIDSSAASEQVTLAKEQTEFRFEGDPLVWRTTKAQGRYDKVSLSQMGDQVERPLVVETVGGPVVAVAEAKMVDYARMKLRVDEQDPSCAVSQLASPVTAKGSLATPWRVVMVGDTPGELVENNYLILNLNDPCAIEDTSWIKPGKVLRDITLTTKGGRACVDFAAKYGIEYVEFDAGWYGHEYDDASDATTISVDPKRSPGPLDLKGIVKYAESKGVGIIVYVNRRALEKQLDEILPLYKSWGIKGVKYGFVNVGSQKWTSWLHEAIRKAADHELMVDVHDEYRTTGYERTYPNWMTQEGVGGDETGPPPEQTLTMLFTRTIAGPCDFKICYFNERVASNWTHCHQLAKSMCFYDPWQFLFWYDTPLSQEDQPPGKNFQVIHETPELEFWRHMPTVWDESRVLHGAIGQYGVFARRSGDDWYVGGLTNKEARELPTKLDFLEAGIEYTAHVYSDDPTVDTVTHVRIDRVPVDSDTEFTITMPSNGGQVLRITPKAD